MNRRTFLKGIAATAAGILIPDYAAAEPHRRVWALDRTMAQKPYVVMGGWMSSNPTEFIKIPIDARVRFSDGRIGVYPIIDNGLSWSLVTEQPGEVEMIRYLKTVGGRKDSRWY